MEQHSEEKKVKKEQLNNLQEQVNFLYQCLQQASSVKGGFELHDIKVIKESKDVLMNLFEDIDENILATDEDIEALDVLMKSIQIQQVKGAFNFDGALLLLKTFETLTKELDSRKDPILKMKEIRNKNKQQASRNI